MRASINGEQKKNQTNFVVNSMTHSKSFEQKSRVVDLTGITRRFYFILFIFLRNTYPHKIKLMQMCISETKKQKQNKTKHQTILAGAVK